MPLQCGMFRRLQIIRAPRFAFFFRRLDPTKTDMALIHVWVLRLGWLEIRRWNDELLDLLEIAGQDTKHQPTKEVPSATAKP